MSEFAFDVFLSHSSKDKPVVRDIAERLRADGLRVWFDEWILKPGDHVHAKIEDGLERSRVLVLCMSANAFGSDWAQLESGTFRFRDPLNKELRFIPLRLDEAPIKVAFAHFLYIKWEDSDREQEYPKLLEACRPPAKAVAERGSDRVVQLDYKSEDWAFAFSPDGKRVLTGLEDRTVRLWDIETGRCLRVLEGHTQRVSSVVWSADQHYALSDSWDCTVRLWDLKSGLCLVALTGHNTGYINGVDLSADHCRALSGGNDNALWL